VFYIEHTGRIDALARASRTAGCSRLDAGTGDLTLSDYLCPARKKDSGWYTSTLTHFPLFSCVGIARAASRPEALPYAASSKHLPEMSTLTPFFLVHTGSG
jgi:hypothetical protein